MAVAHGIIIHISVVQDTWAVTEGSESQSVRYKNVFSVPYDDVIRFITLLILWKKNLTRLNCDKFPRLRNFLTENGTVQPHTLSITDCFLPRGTICTFFGESKMVQGWGQSQMSLHWLVNSCSRRVCSLNFLAIKLENCICSTFWAWFLV